MVPACFVNTGYMSAFFVTACSIYAHLLCIEWEPRPFEHVSHTVLRRVIMSLIQLGICGLTLGYITNRIPSPWTTARLVMVNIGVFDLLHTLILHMAWYLVPHTRPSGAVSYMTGGKSAGPPSPVMYLHTSLFFIIPAIFNERFRDGIAMAYRDATWAKEIVECVILPRPRSATN